MSNPLLLETIRLTDGELPLLEYHQRRVDRSRRFYYAKAPALKLAAVVKELALPDAGLYKLRLIYGSKLVSYEVLPYEIRPVNSLRIINADDLEYGRKYADREAIEHLYQRRQNCDDILMVQKGHLTDTSYANVALYDGKKWHTPAWPLLRGARRDYLIEQKIIIPSVIRLRDLGHFTSLRLLNSMMDWEDGPTVRTTAILNN